MVFENNLSDHEIWSIRCHVGIHVDFTSILHSPTPLVPQALCEANLDRLSFSTNESAWSEVVTGSQSRVWSGPTSSSQSIAFSPSPLQKSNLVIFWITNVGQFPATWRSFKSNFDKIEFGNILILKQNNMFTTCPMWRFLCLWWILKGWMGMSEIDF